MCAADNLNEVVKKYKNNFNLMKCYPKESIVEVDEI
jgi:hypothetical protein